MEVLQFTFEDKSILTHTNKHDFRTPRIDTESIISTDFSTFTTRTFNFLKMDVRNWKRKINTGGLGLRKEVWIEETSGF